MILYTAGYKYKLDHSLGVTLPPELVKLGLEFDTSFVSVFDNILWIQMGYAWDGPSGPLPDWKILMVPSLIHDAWYQLIREGHAPAGSQIAADEWFGELCKERGVWGWVADGFVTVLLQYGKNAIENKRVVQEAY